MTVTTMTIKLHCLAGKFTASTENLAGALRWQPLEIGFWRNLEQSHEPYSPWAIAYRKRRVMAETQMSCLERLKSF